jgi:hypothetical protein
VTHPFELAPPDQTYVRDALFGIELLDAVTLASVSQGVEVVAEGLLQRKPIVNGSGVFVWLREDLSRLKKVTIDPVLLPYEKVELDPSQVQPLKVTTVELRPRVDYVFAAGTAGTRGLLVEERAGRVPVRDAEVRLQWLDENGVFRDAPTASHTDDKGGFAAIVRLAAADVPQLDSNGLLTVRLRARRGGNERGSPGLKLPQGRVADLTFAWDELQP